ncbi:Fatty acid synthase [Ooceraea biroi]|uniref:Fatty acid synthase n=1 Tax=Ooceraea biroi TaxID=2015173 RepID=A0A026VXL7_OOCBI|nr:Fatty acid synthase [Ooceraea biroi]
MSYDGDIVISGISGRFPKSSNVEEFIQNLMDGADLITDDDARWSSSLFGIPTGSGKLDDLSSFDASFFGVPAKLAHVMDPQIRIFLEATFETLIDAGVNPVTMRGSRTGVFVGVSMTDAESYWLQVKSHNLTGYEMLGCFKPLIANRISFVYDFIGPSFIVDTACSSSLTAMKEAVNSMRAGDCDAAIVGGVNLLLRPEHAVNLTRLGVLSESNKDKPFDVTADGYVRAEAISAIYLQKAKDARRIYATVVGIETNTDGYKLQGISFPSTELQYQLMQETCIKAGINPADVVYVEAHGTGTIIGDPEEVNSIDRVFCKNRTTPLLIGSVKSNTGHTEATAGMCSIIKALAAMETGVIPANLHYSTPNPKLTSVLEGRIQVVDKHTPWNRKGLIAVNAFGFGGTNGHVLLRSNPKQKTLDMAVDTPPKLIAVSGRTEEAVHVLLNKANEHAKDKEFIALLHAIHSNHIPGHRYRSYEILGVNNTRELSAEIATTNAKRPIWFVLDGMGCHWVGMGRDLLKIEVCKRSMQRCADALKPHGIDFMNLIMNSTKEMLETPRGSFIGIVGTQIALVDLLTSINIHPDGIIGHSMGELVCGYADGLFTLEETILTARYRALAIETTTIEAGAMAAVGLTWEEAEKMCPPGVSPACHNSLDSVTVSGQPEPLQKFMEELKSKGIFAKAVDSAGLAFHSKYIKPMADKMYPLLKEMIPNPKPRSARWISSSTPDADPSARLNSAEYHTRNLTCPVRFQEAVLHIPDDAIVIEIAPHCLMKAILSRSLPPTVTNIHLQRRDQPDNFIYLLSNLGKLYMAGAEPDFSKLYPPVNFPVSRGTPMIAPHVKWDHSAKWKVPIHDKPQNVSEYIVEIDVSNEEYAYILEHKIDGRVIMPGAQYVLMVWQTFAKLHNTHFDNFPVVFEKLCYHRATIVSKDAKIQFAISIFKKTGMFEVSESDAIVFSGNVHALAASEKDQLNISSLVLPPVNTDFLPLRNKDMYRELNSRGYEFCGSLQGIKSCDNHITVGEISWYKEWVPFIEAVFQFSVVSYFQKLVYGLRITYLSIDPILQKQVISGLPEDDIAMPICYYKNVDVTKCGGIEFFGNQTSLPQRLQIRTDVSYERYVFVPYENSHSLAKDSINGTLHALTVMLEIIHENITTLQIKAVEVADGRTGEALLAPLVLNILHNIPLITIDLEVVAASSDNYTESFNQMNVDLNFVIRNVNNAPPANDVHLVIAADVLTNQSDNILKNLATALKPDCFVLLEESAAQLDLKILLKTDLVLIAKQISSAGKTYLLLKKQQNKRKQIVINITEKNLSWLDSVKAALKKSKDNDHEVLLVSQGNEVSGLVGLMTRIRSEVGGANARYVFIQDKNAPTFNLSTQLYADQLNKGLMANVLKGGYWGSYRHLKVDQYSSVRTEHAYINALKKGSFKNLTWIQSPVKGQSSSTRSYGVYYAAISARDAMLALGKSPSDVLSGEMDMEDPVLGLEFSGRSMNGRRVMGIVKAGGLATTISTDSDLIWHIPDKWTLEEAATVPIAYAISYYALIIRGQLKAGENVLIHVDSNGQAPVAGVGQAAINLALHMGCKVFTVISVPDIRESIKKIFPQLPDKHIGTSRDKSFEQLILNETQQRGVDVMLSSLTEEELQVDSICLATNGRLLKIGSHTLPNDYFSKSMTYHMMTLETLFEECAEKTTLIKLMSEGIGNGAVRPLSSIVFSEQFEEGFKFLSTNEYIGKILLKIRNEESYKHVPPTPKIVDAIACTYFNSGKSYILFDGLEGFGPKIISWMITRGAKFIVLATSVGVRTGYQSLCLRHWSEAGINVVVSTADITTSSGVEKLIKESSRLAPVGGIFNFTTISSDTLLENLQETDFKTVLSMIDGTKNLDTVSRKLCPSLDYFVVFSCGRGNLAQCNVAYATSAMERIMEQRQAAGLPGLAIQWGAFENPNTAENDVVTNGVLPQRISSCLATIDTFLQHPHQILCSTVVAEKNTDDATDSNSKNTFARIISKILGIKDINAVNANDTFVALGMDSLGYMEMQQLLDKEYNLTMSIEEISSLTITKVKDFSTLKDN